MGLIFTPPLSIAEAKSLGYDVYEVLFANWGIQDGVSFADMQFPIPGQPGIPVSLAGIAIGPRSTVDRVWVSYEPLKRRNPLVLNQPNSLLRMCSVESPLMFAQAAGKPGVKNDPGVENDPALTLSDKGQLYIFPMANKPAGDITFAFQDGFLQETTCPPLTYIDVNGVEQSLRNGLTTPFKFMAPFLHLYLYLKIPPIPIIDTKRAPLLATGQILLPINEQDNEHVIAQIPTYGRKAIKIGLRGSAECDFRIAALRAISQDGAMFEQPVDKALAVPALTPTVLSPCNECCHYADYTIIYATPKTDAGTTVKFQVTAYD